MNLYRLDLADGRAVRDLFGTVLIRSASDARARAKSEAAREGQRVTVTRISRAGSLRVMYSINPDGSTVR